MDLPWYPVDSFPLFLEMGPFRPVTNLLGSIFCRSKDEEYVAGDYRSFHIKRIGSHSVDHGNIGEALE
jgi:hypothetical protein